MRFKPLIGMALVLFMAGVAQAQSAASFVKQWEGFSAVPYKDAGGYSIGFGHLILPGEKLKYVTKAEAEHQLAKDLAKREPMLDDLVRVKLNPNQRIALMSLMYNIGDGNLAKSALLRKVNKGDFAGAKQEFAKWNKSQGKVLPGLTKRRQAEANLFAS